MHSDTVIKIEDLGKRYIIKHAAQKEFSDSVTGSLGNMAKHAYRRILHPLSITQKNLTRKISLYTHYY